MMINIPMKGKEIVHHHQKKKDQKIKKETIEPSAHDITFLGNELSLPLAEELSPMQYFKKFWNNNITNNLATQINIYSVQKSGKCIDANAQEIERFIGIQMLMSIISLRSYELYWSKICVMIVLPM